MATKPAVHTSPRSKLCKLTSLVAGLTWLKKTATTLFGVSLIMAMTYRKGRDELLPKKSHCWTLCLDKWPIPALWYQGIQLLKIQRLWPVSGRQYACIMAFKPQEHIFWISITSSLNKVNALKTCFSVYKALSRTVYSDRMVLSSITERYLRMMKNFLRHWKM